MPFPDTPSSDFAYRDRLQQTARIIARQRLTVRAEDDLRSTGGTFEAGGDVALDAGGALELKARAAEQRLHLKKRGLTVNRLTVRQEQSHVAAGGDVTLRAGGDVGLTSTGVSGGGDVTVAAGGDVTIRGAQEREESAFDLSISSGGLFGTKTKIEDRRTQTEVARSELSAGGDLTITAGTETDLLGQMERGVVRATTRAGVQTALQGGPLEDNLVASLKSAGAALAGAELAGVIGAEYRAAARDGLDPLEYGLQKVAHAALGCGLAAAGGGHCGAGAAAGAASAVALEARGNPAAKAAELNRLVRSNKATRAEALRTMVQWEQEGVDLGRLAGALGALVAGGKEAGAAVQAGTAVGGNVAANNYLETAWDLASLAMSVAELGLAISDEESSKLDVALAGGAVVLDGLAVLLPGVPGGAGATLHATKEGGQVVVKALTPDGRDVTAALKTAAKARQSDTLAAKTGAKFVFDPKTGRYRNLTTGRFVSARDLPWPVNRGFTSSSPGTLQPGMVIDRFGPTTGRFAGQPGATISQRGMAAGSEALPYARYEILKPLPAQVGPAAPVSAFGAEGGATQYLFQSSIVDLVEQGFLRALP